MNNLSQRLLRPVEWWVYRAPKRLFIVITRLIVLVNHAVSFTLNLRLLFVPLFGDYTVAGRVIGLLFRIGWLFLGLFVLLLLGVSLLLAPLLWYLFPFILFYLLDWWSLPIFAGFYLGYFYLERNVPLKKVAQIETGDFGDSVRPGALIAVQKLRKPGNLHEFLALPNIRYLLTKLELNNEEFKEALVIPKDVETWKILKRGFELAQKEGTRYIEIEHLFYGLLSFSPGIEDLLMSYGLSLEDVQKTIFWIVDERERLSRVFFWQEGYNVDRLGGYGRGMTGRVTPALDAVSTDFTELAKKGLIRGIIAHQDEIEEIAKLLSGSEKVNVMIIGQPGSGKTSVVKGIAKSIVEGTEYEKVANKRIVSLESGALVSGAQNSGDIAERFKKIMDEVLKSGDIILFFDEVHNLVSGVGGEEADISSVYSILEPYLSTGEVQVIAATNRANYRKYIEPNGAFARLFHIVDIEPSTEDETKAILMHLSFDIEKQENVVVTYPAVQAIIRLSSKLMQQRVFPDKAVDILNRCVTGVSGDERVVTAEKVAEVISEVTHVPVTSLSEDESEKLLNLEAKMKERIIGQDYAVGEVVKALKRARVGIRDEDKPIASFLFVGTTGVGKTETAKTLARQYFGAEDKMIRLDMSEYQQQDSVDKLIGTSDGGQGILTEAVRANPFSVLLLDEIEKANSRVLLTFLQVLDDGRLTDSNGITVSFANTIIIATSNVGTREIQLVAQRDGAFNEMEEAAMKKVRDHFAPEFLNRFNGIIVFNPLTRENVKKIARILLQKVEKVAAGKDIKVSFSEDLLEGLVERGYNREWGARPLARVIEDKVETYLAEKLLSGEIKRGDTVELTAEVF